MEKFIFRVIVLCFAAGIIFVGIETYKTLTKPDEKDIVLEDTTEEIEDYSILNSTATWVNPVEQNDKENLTKLKEKEELKKMREKYNEGKSNKVTKDKKVETSPSEPFIGMTDYEVLESTWGKPKSINRTETIYGVREQWVYDRGYLYFEDHYLTSISSSR